VISTNSRPGKVFYLILGVLAASVIFILADRASFSLIICCYKMAYSFFSTLVVLEHDLL
jgi:hypothetical protein